MNQLIAEKFDTYQIWVSMRDILHLIMKFILVLNDSRKNQEPFTC